MLVQWNSLNLELSGCEIPVITTDKACKKGIDIFQLSYGFHPLCQPVSLEPNRLDFFSHRYCISTRYQNNASRIPMSPEARLRSFSGTHSISSSQVVRFPS